MAVDVRIPGQQLEAEVMGARADDIARVAEENGAKRDRVRGRGREREGGMSAGCRSGEERGN